MSNTRQHARTHTHVHTSTEHTHAHPRIQSLSHEKWYKYLSGLKMSACLKRGTQRTNLFTDLTLLSSLCSLSYFLLSKCVFGSGRRRRKKRRRDGDKGPDRLTENREVCWTEAREPIPRGAGGWGGWEGLLSNPHLRRKVRQDDASVPDTWLRSKIRIRR